MSCASASNQSSTSNHPTLHACQVHTNITEQGAGPGGSLGELQWAPASVSSVLARCSAAGDAAATGLRGPLIRKNAEKEKHAHTHTHNKLYKL